MERIQYLCGSVPSEIIDLIESLPDYSKAVSFHNRVQNGLRAMGYACEREYKIRDRGDGRIGAIDLVAFKNGVTVGIELDSQRPRRKSIEKLSRLGTDGSLVAVRTLRTSK